MNKKIIITISFLISITIILGIIILLQKNTSPTLTITTTPSEAQVFINGHYLALTPHSTTLAKGSYIIQVIKPEFLPQEEQIVLTSNKEVSFNLTAVNQNTPSQISPQNKLLIIDPKTSELIEISPSKTTTIHDQPISSFSYSHPLVAVIKKNITDNFSYINLNNGIVKDVAVKEIEPIIGLSLSPDAQKIHFLGSFSAQKLSSTIYSSPLLQKKINSITSSSYTKIYPLTSPFILALMEADGPDATRFTVINEDNPHTPLSYQSTSEINHNPQYLQFISQTSSESALFRHPYTKSSSVNIPTKPGFMTVWLSADTILLVRPLRVGANYQYFNVAESSITPERKWDEVDTISLHQIPGISEGKIAIIDKQNNIIFLEPPRL